MNPQLDTLKKEYDNIPLPEDLNERILTMLKTNAVSKRPFYKTSSFAAAIALFLVLTFTVTLNVSPAMAETLSTVPVLGNIVKLLTFREINVHDDYTDIQVTVPKVEGLSDPKAEETINTALEKKATDTVATVKEDAVRVKEAAQAAGLTEVLPANVFENYDLKSITNHHVSFGVVTLKVGASGAETATYYNINLSDNTLFYLSDLFKKDYDYVSVLTNIILGKMKADMADPASGKMYFIAEDDMAPFTSLRPDQIFYIDKEGQLVIAFDEYDVAPGSMGRPEFVIPMADIQDGLVDEALFE